MQPGVAQKARHSQQYHLSSHCAWAGSVLLTSSSYVGAQHWVVYRCLLVMLGRWLSMTKTEQPGAGQWTNISTKPLQYWAQAYKLILSHDHLQVSPCDARMTAFYGLDNATRCWVKGRQFSIAGLLADTEQGHPLAKTFDNGCMMIFRLAPQVSMRSTVKMMKATNPCLPVSACCVQQQSHISTQPCCGTLAVQKHNSGGRIMTSFAVHASVLCKHVLDWTVQ